MKQTHSVLPIYTSDVSGVCSALYEMGGMVVMHDPSGCNSTFNTHDEIRWYEKDSLIFISGLTERDAIMGNDEKFYRDVLETAQELHPAFIAITNSPIPYLMGTDFPAIVKRLEREAGIPAFYVPANGMHDYTAGAGKAFEKTARHLVQPAGSRIPGSVNILGMTPLDFAAQGCAGSIRRVFENAGFEVLSVWAMEDASRPDASPGEAAKANAASERKRTESGRMHMSEKTGISDDAPDRLLRQIRRAGEAAVNIVVSSVGLPAAKVLRERFGTPYVVGAPVGDFTDLLTGAAAAAIKHAEGKKAPAGNGLKNPAECSTVYLTVPEPADRTVPADAVFGGKTAAGGKAAAAGKSSDGKDTAVFLIGEPVVMGSLAAAIRLKYGLSTQVLCPTEITEGLTGPRDRVVHGEEETQQVLQNASCVIADPFYQWICPPDVRFYPLPTLSLSGRSHLKEAKNLAEINI